MVLTTTVTLGVLTSSSRPYLNLKDLTKANKNLVENNSLIVCFHPLVVPPDLVSPDLFRRGAAGPKTQAAGPKSEAAGPKSQAAGPSTWLLL